MIGFALGTASLLGLVALRRQRCRGSARNCGAGGGSCGRGGQGPGGCEGRGRGFPGGGFRGGMFRALRSLGLTRAQWSALREAEDELVAVAMAERPVIGRTRRTVGKTLEAATFDGARLEGAFAEHDAALAKLRTATLAFAKRVHETLDPSQRARVARWIELGPLGSAIVGAEGA